MQRRIRDLGLPCGLADRDDGQDAELNGVTGALVAALVGMVVATLAWAAGVSLLRVLGLVR